MFSFFVIVIVLFHIITIYLNKLYYLFIIINTTMRNKKYIFYIIWIILTSITVIFLIVSYVNNHLLNNMSNIAYKEDVNPDIWQISINKNEEEKDLDLLKKQQHQKYSWGGWLDLLWVRDEEANQQLSSLSSNTKLTNKKWKNNIYILINNIDKNTYNILKSYLSKANLILKDTYNFYIIKSKSISNTQSCQYWFRDELFKWKLSVINKSRTIIYDEAIKYFNKTKTSKNDKLFIFNNNTLNINCNNIDSVKADIKAVTKNNNKILIFDTKDADQIKKDFFNNLAIYTGVVNIPFDTDIDLRNKLNDYIYPIENKLELTSSQWDIQKNTYIEFFDAQNNNYQWELTTYKKEGTIFKVIDKNTYVKEHIIALDAWIYKFLAYDPVTNIYLETEPIVINKINKFEYKFIFRKTKLKIELFDENMKPILWDIRIKWIERKNIVVNNFDQQSKVITNVNPWKYEISVKTNNNFVFNAEFIINGEETLLKEYITLQQEIQISVVDQDNVKLENALITINRWNKLYNSKKGNDIIFKLPLWRYTINAIDSTSWNATSKFLEITNIDEQSYMKKIKLSLEAYPVSLDLWSKWHIVKIYNKLFHEKEIKKISWTGVKELLLSEWEYKIKVYSKDNKFLYNSSFEVDDFIKNKIIIKKEEDIF